MTPKVERLVTLATGLLQPFLHENEEILDGRKGACLAILATRDTRHDDKEVLVFDIGDIPPDKVEEKRDLAKEKVLRLERNPDHLTSFESQDKKLNHYGGAVRANPRLLISLSGFKPAVLDQEFCILLAMLDYQMSALRAHEIRQRTLHEYPHPYQPYL